MNTEITKNYNVEKECKEHEIDLEEYKDETLELETIIGETQK